uniref:Arrestin_C domain-containing protein n=1 Tax=Rhabditophanes sp. KR3021 TaxID=114890 RepID=A0AC35UB41_9BILA
MVKLKRFEIVFNSPEDAFFAGQEISGKLIVESGDDKKVNEILLEIKGRAKTYWSKGSGKNVKHCGRSEPYFCEQFNTNYTHKLDVAGEVVGKGHKERILPKGVHEIPFQYTLPKTLPTSFEGSYGYVRYSCRAIFERPWDFDICTKKLFTVTGIEDINDDSHLLVPITVEESCVQKSRLCCKPNGPVLLELSCDRTGYTSGEYIILNGKVQNKTGNLIKNVFVTFTQSATFKANNFAGTNFEKQERKVIMKSSLGEIKGNSVKSIEKEMLVIPSLPPSLATCSLIDIKYCIELAIGNDGKIEIPIVIGTIPLLGEMLSRKTRDEFYKTIGGGKKSCLFNGVNSGGKKHSLRHSKVKVTVTDECGVTIKTTPTSSRSVEHSEVEDNEAAEHLLLQAAKKRVRMPSTILSEIYPTLPSPYYKESFFGSVNVRLEKEEEYFGDSLFAPKYPFYVEEDENG